MIMAKFAKTVKVDPDKFMAWYKSIVRKNGFKSAAEFADGIGYNHTFVYNVRDRKQMSAPAFKSCELVYGLKLEDIQPDEQKPEEAKAGPEKALETVQNTVDLSVMEDTLKREFLTLTEMKGFMDDVRRGFRVQTLPRIDTECIAEGVCNGISRFWERNKKDIISQLRGLVFAGAFEAGKKLDEMKN